jgi:hypothetical protein
MVRPNFIFSYWIFAWYLLYFFGFFKLYNPKFAIILGIAENLIMLFLMFYYNTKYNLILLFIILFTILKIIPIYTIWNDKIHNKDIIATFVLFIIYLFWCRMNNNKISNFIKTTKDLILHNKNTFPGMVIFQKIGL